MQTHAGTHLDQVHFARPHEVKREPIKRAVMPVTIGRAGGGAGVKGALERAALAHTEMHMPRPLTGHAPPTLSTHGGATAHQVPTGYPWAECQQTSSTSNKGSKDTRVGPHFMQDTGVQKVKSINNRAKTDPRSIQLQYPHSLCHSSHSFNK